MTDLIDITADRFIFRRPDGSIMLDTTERTPAEIQRFQITGLTVDWPTVSGETNVWQPISGNYRHDIPAHNTYATQSIGAIAPAGVTPQFFLTTIKMTQTLMGSAGGNTLWCRQPQGISMGMVGSLHLESHAVYVFRAINIAAVGGNIVLEKRQMGIGYSQSFNAPQSTRSTYTMDIDVAWGLFDG